MCKVKCHNLESCSVFSFEHCPLWSRLGRLKLIIKQLFYSHSDGASQVCEKENANSNHYSKITGVEILDPFLFSSSHQSFQYSHLWASIEMVIFIQLNYITEGSSQQNGESAQTVSDWFTRPKNFLAPAEKHLPAKQMLSLLS